MAATNPFVKINAAFANQTLNAMAAFAANLPPAQATQLTYLVDMLGKAFTEVERPVDQEPPPTTPIKES